MKAQPKTSAKPSLVEFAVLIGACPLAGIGAALAFASVLVGLTVAGAGLVAVGAYGAVTYGLAANLIEGLRDRRLKLLDRGVDARRLSVTEIAGRRREAADPVARPGESADVAPSADITQPTLTERVVPLRTRALR